MYNNIPPYVCDEQVAYICVKYTHATSNVNKEYI